MTPDDPALAAAAAAALAAYAARRDAERRRVPADALAVLVACEVDAERAYLLALAARHARP
jgi:MYXO-CTERM domain-containing protein